MDEVSSYFKDYKRPPPPPEPTVGELQHGTSLLCPGCTRAYMRGDMMNWQGHRIFFIPHGEGPDSVQIPIPDSTRVSVAKQIIGRNCSCQRI